jgi:predicted DNA-binding protein
MNPKPQLRGQHAVKIFVSTELKARLSTLSQQLGRPLADVTRTLIWMGLPILEGMEAAQSRGSRWWLRQIGHIDDDTIEEIT